MTNTARSIELTSIPSMTSMLLKAATTRKRVQAEPEFPPLTVSVIGIRADATKLAKFNDVCGFNQGETLPLPYPHIMAFALHLQLLLEPEFPFTPMGAVHVHNRIRQQRPIGKDEVLDFEARLGSAERVSKGYEISIITEVSVGGEKVWDDLSVMLVRKGGSGAGKEKKPPVEAPQYRESIQWELAANMGRRYAAASGDYNPIHLYPVTAKLMGFKRQIMHGMWSKSRCVAHLLPPDYEEVVSVEASFKLPIYLPASVKLLYNSDDAGSQFELKDAGGSKPHLAGAIILGAGG